MNRQHTSFQLSKRILLIVVSLFLTITLTSACYCEDDQMKSAENNILLLKFNQKDSNFTAGKEYSYFKDRETFTLKLDQKKLSDRTTTTLHYVEMNALLFKAETVHNGTIGTKHVPEDFRNENFFERKEADDLIYAKGYKVLTGEGLESTDFDKMWLQIQNLTKVRAYMKTNPDQEVNIISSLTTASKDLNNSEWIFVIKN